MIQPLSLKSLFLSFLAAIAVIAVLGAAKLGLLEGPVFAAVSLAFLAGFLGWAAYSLKRKLEEWKRISRQLRFVAERLQAMVKTLPAGYCLFSPQGLLREEQSVASRLGLAKLTQFDDIISGIKEAPELTAVYRRLQHTGDGFSLTVTPLVDKPPVHVVGRRFRAGREGPQLDALWFCDFVPASDEGKKKEPDKSRETFTPGGFLADAQTIINAMPFPVWARARDLRIIICNNAYARALDASIEEVLREQHELVSQMARGGTGKALAANALNKNERQIERRHVIIAGKRRLLEITEMPFSAAFPGGDKNTGTAEGEEKDDSAPNPIALIGFAIDVTTEEEKESELQRHLAAHHEVMEHLGSAIAIYGRDMRLEFYNRSYQKLWEAEESFLNSKPTFAEVLEDLRARRRLPEQTDFHKYKRERISLFTSLLEPQEDQMFLPDGTTLRILAVPHPFGGIMFVHENVTNILALESSYNTLMAVQRETLDNLAEGIAVFGPDGKTRLFNPAFAVLWKLDPEYLGGQPHVADLLERMKPLLVFGGDWTAFRDEMTGYALDRLPHTGRIERTDGKILEYATVPLPDGSVLNSYHDVSDSARVEQALRASNAALAAADRLKSEFVANVSYQLRTPLNTIAGFADILSNQYFGTLNDRQLEYTRTIKAETEKLARLINDVLDLAIIEAGRMALNRKEISAAGLLNSAKMMTAEWARQQKLEIVVDCPPDIGTFPADEHRAKQILFNLISNAIKYTPEDGRITLGAERKNGWMVISVTDTGIGIPEPDRDRVFGKFERSNLRAGQSGAGLGLSLVKSLVDLHGGRVEINSGPGGTRVSCFFPQQPPETPETEETGAL